jgi:hypothetical protein
MSDTLQLIPSERRSDGRLGTAHGIMRARPKFANGQLPPATAPPSLRMGAWPTNQPHAPTSRALTPGEGRWVHPRLHDSTAPQENAWPTSSLWTFSPKESMMRFPQCRKCESDKENPPIFPTIVHVSLSLYKLCKRPSTTI